MNDIWDHTLLLVTCMHYPIGKDFSLLLLLSFTVIAPRSVCSSFLPNPLGIKCFVILPAHTHS
jgi:hypothetical protein